MLDRWKFRPTDISNSNHPTHMKLRSLLISALAAASVGSASAASYTVFSGSPVDLGISGTNVNFVLPQFDSSLGTLTGVRVIVVQSALAGSFTVTNNGETDIEVDKVTSDFRVQQVSSGLGYSQVLIELDPLGTDPVSNPSATIAPTKLQEFTITSSAYTISDQIIDGAFFSAYEGSGDVTFGIRNRLIVTTTGATFAVDSGNVATTTQMAIEYTYEVIPEPSTALLGSLGLFALLRRRR